MPGAPKRNSHAALNRPFECAIFLSPTETFHADSCEPVRQAVKKGELVLHGFGRRSYPGTPLPAGVIPEVCSIGYWDARGPQSWGLDWHRNEGIELTYVARGRTAFLVDKEQFQLRPGDLTVTRPWQMHRVGNPNIDSLRLYFLILDVGVRRPNQPWQWPPWFILSPVDRRRLTTLLRHNEHPVWSADREIARCFEKIGALVDQGDPTTVQTQLQLCLNELCLGLLDLLTRKNAPLDAHLSTTQRSVEMFLAALPDHLEAPWTLDEMARQCGLGRTRFADYCRQITNLTPADYLANCRVEAAKKLLTQSVEIPITEIALSCGFQTSQYFATVFHRKTGISPREFRARALPSAVLNGQAGRKTAGW